MRRLAVFLFLILPAHSPAQSPRLPPGTLDALSDSPIRTPTLSGRVTALAADEKRSATHYVGTAAGGLWKTTDHGASWAVVFAGRPHPSIGAVALAPANPRIVWVGTGEANARNSVSWGNGVFRSLDGGKTWESRGLSATHHIGRIVIHPRDPHTVYVAALGHLWGPNKERGVFRTRDGGTTWDHVLALDADTGCIDLVLDPIDPRNLYACAYRVRRDGFAGGNPRDQFGPLAGLYRSRDEGTSWTRLTQGLPTRPLGRCGLAISRKDPRYLVAVVQTDRTDIRRIPGQGPSPNSQPDTGGIFRSHDRGETWIKVNDLCPRPFYFGQIRIDPFDEARIYVLGIPLFVSSDGGHRFVALNAPGIHVDHHDLWIDPADPRHLILGNDGGVYYSSTRGAGWNHARNLPLAQFYGISLDLHHPPRIYGGLQDNGTWGGSLRAELRPGSPADDWKRYLGFDGFRCQVDPDDPNTLYAEGQYGRVHRIDVPTGHTALIRPTPPRASDPPYRFNWNSPLILSPHDSRTVYFGGNLLFQSRDRGQTWRAISPDLTRGHPGPSGHTGHTLTALVESPLRKGLLYAGSDDGRIHVSRNGGQTWTDVSQRLPGVPPARWITALECSPFREGTAWLALTRHRQDDRLPYLFQTDDHGTTWRSVARGLPPEGPVHIVRADPIRPGLLFAGTEFGLFFSWTPGGDWQPLRAGLPPVPVHDLVINPSTRELVVATHGRGLFLLNIAPLEELTPEVLAAPFHLLDLLVSERPVSIHGPLRPTLSVSYLLRDRPLGDVTLTALDSEGHILARLPASAAPGFHRVHWDLPRPPMPAKGLPTPSLEYTLRLQVADRVMAKRIDVLP